MHTFSQFITLQEGDKAAWKKGQAITRPIEVEHNPKEDNYTLFDGNHRVKQAHLNGDTHTKAWVQNPLHRIRGEAANRKWKAKEINEQRHNQVKAYRDWGVIHPKTGEITSGLDHPHARQHADLIRSLPAKHREHYAQYAHVNYGHGDGMLTLSHVHKKNRAGVMKAFDNLPHHPSGEVEMEHEDGHGNLHSTTGNRLQIHNANRAASVLEN